jgi:hypothetical protein
MDATASLRQYGRRPIGKGNVDDHAVRVIFTEISCGGYTTVELEGDSRRRVYSGGTRG